MVPYDYHYDDQTVMTKESALVQVIKIDGLLFDSLTEEQVKQFEVRRNTLLRTVAFSNLGLYVHTIRRKVFDFPEGEAAPGSPSNSTLLGVAAINTKGSTSTRSISRWYATVSGLVYQG